MAGGGGMLTMSIAYPVSVFDQNSRFNGINFPPSYTVYFPSDKSQALATQKDYYEKIQRAIQQISGLGTFIEHYKIYMVRMVVWLAKFLQFRNMNLEYFDIDFRT